MIKPPPHRTTTGPYGWSYCRILGGGRFLMSEVPLYSISAALPNSQVMSYLGFPRWDSPLEPFSREAGPTLEPFSPEAGPDPDSHER